MLPGVIKTGGVGGHGRRSLGSESGILDLQFLGPHAGLGADRTVGIGLRSFLETIESQFRLVLCLVKLGQGELGLGNEGFARMTLDQVFIGGCRLAGLVLSIQAGSDAEKRLTHERTVMVLAGKLLELHLRLFDLPLSEQAARCQQ